MNADDDLAPAVRAILRAAEDRPHPANRVSVTPRSLPAAIDTTASAGRMPVIAEIKPTSPTTPTTRTDDPVALANTMVDAGATALSVLTEPTHFGGSIDALRRVRDAVSVPVLRKDFILHESHLDHVEADIVLLIARFTDALDTLVTAALDRGFQVLVEVHTSHELETALETDASIIGINNRNLTDLTVDLQTFERLAPTVPDTLTLIAESGITHPDDARRMRRAGADALLIGTAIMDGNVAKNTNRFAQV